MKSYLIIHIYAILVFLGVSLFLRVLLGKVKTGITEQTGKASGIVDLEVTKS